MATLISSSRSIRSISTSGSGVEVAASGSLISIFSP
jgi:hypothetical protein